MNMTRVHHAVRFTLAHTLASLLATAIFVACMLIPYTPYAAWMDWSNLIGPMKPYAIGLAVSIWLIAALPAIAVHKLIRIAGLKNRQDYVLIGMAAGLAMAFPVLKIMGVDVVNTIVSPVITPARVLLNQMMYAIGWGLAGAAFGLCYYWLHSERY
ncbi:MAG: hypothetical protein DI585_06885 [Pseudomonas fluorescens]|nr:MAG: hypothetical protein DI585_06885 [Pseudomonas fluorescens]